MHSFHRVVALVLVLCCGAFFLAGCGLDKGMKLDATIKELEKTLQEKQSEQKKLMETVNLLPEVMKKRDMLTKEIKKANEEKKKLEKELKRLKIGGA